MKGQPVLGVVIIPDEYQPLHCLYPPLAHLLTPLMPRAKTTPSICTNPHPLPYQCQSLNPSSLPRGPWGYTLSLYTLKPTTPSPINVHVSDRLLWPPIYMRCGRLRFDIWSMLWTLERIFLLVGVFSPNFIILSLYTLKLTMNSTINVHVSDQLFRSPIYMRYGRPCFDVGLMLEALETILILVHVFFLSNFIILSRYTLKHTIPSPINVHVLDRLCWPSICMRCGKPCFNV